jgi:hypothetical protein
MTTLNDLFFAGFLSYPLVWALAPIGFIQQFYCSYHTPGTKLLFFNLILGWSWLLLRFIRGLTEHDIVALFFVVPLHGLWLWVCYKLREINKRKQLDEILAIPKYYALCNAIRTAQSPEERYARYKQALIEAPEVRKHIKKIFKKD